MFGTKFLENLNLRFEMTQIVTIKKCYKVWLIVSTYLQLNYVKKENGQNLNLDFVENVEKIELLKELLMEFIERLK